MSGPVDMVEGAARPEPEMVSSLLELRGIKKSFGGVRALRGVSLDLGQVKSMPARRERCRQIHAHQDARGHSQSGRRRNPDGWPSDADRLPADAGRLGIRVIHQELALAPNLSVAENLFLGREPARFGFLDKAPCAGKLRRELSRRFSRVARY